MHPVKPECGKCAARVRICRSPQGEGPAYCPTVVDKDTIAQANERYVDDDIHEFARQASVQEAECYIGRGAESYLPHAFKPRVQETCEFAKRMGYRRLGVAFCAGLHEEARVLVRILEAQGFEVASVVCKVGGTPKEALGLRDDQKIRVGEFEPMCSPIAQAMVLNEQRTQFNVVVGLCVGHDSLFLKHAEAPCTVLVAKDRVLGHCPAAALHTAGSYYPWLLREGF